MAPTSGRNRAPRAQRNVRAKPSRQQTKPPTADELAVAARALYLELGSIVKRLDKGREQGKSDGQTWRELAPSLAEGRPIRKSIAATPGVVQALNAFWERTLRERLAFRKGRGLGRLAFRLASGKIKSDVALRRAIEIRGDDALRGSMSELDGALARARGKEARFRAAYRVLAWDSDAWPVPDTARGSRGPLGRLFGIYTALEAQRAMKARLRAASERLSAPRTTKRKNAQKKRARK